MYLFEILQSRQAKYGINVTLSVVLVIGIAIVVNLIVLKRFDLANDLTAEKWYTLSPQTQKVLDNLSTEINITAFFSRNPASEREKRDYDRAKELLKMYRRSSDKINVTFVDTFVDVQKRELYQIRNNGTVAFETGTDDRRELVTAVDEQKFTSAILKVTRGTEQKVYFLVGHGERSIDDFAIGGYSQASEELEKQNYMVLNLSLANRSRVPTDCSTLVISDPERALLDSERKAVEHYLNRSGKLLVMIDAAIGEQGDPNQDLIDLLVQWGIRINRDYVMVLDQRFFSAFGGPATPIFMNFEFHPITQHLLRPTVVFQLTRSVLPQTERLRKQVMVQPLAKLPDFDSNVCWGETVQPTWQNAKYDQSQDTPGPLSVAVAAESEAKTRIVAVGDADFASNQFFSNTSGGEFFLGIMGWLTMEGDLISIRPIDPRTRSLRSMTASEQILVQLVSVFLIPLMISMVGIAVWWRRR